METRSILQQTNIRVNSNISKEKKGADPFFINNDYTIFQWH